MDLTTQYLGLTLENPIVAGSSGMTNSVKKVQQLAQNGAGAVVLKSIFEEEIVFEHEDIMKEAESAGVNLDQFDYYDFHLRGEKLGAYVDLIKEARRRCRFP
jgi:dihydroorotate dehydrogenase (fumarate)